MLMPFLPARGWASTKVLTDTNVCCATISIHTSITHRESTRHATPVPRLLSKPGCQTCHLNNTAHTHDPSNASDTTPLTETRNHVERPRIERSTMAIIAGPYNTAP